jgi:hypothetical protein
MNTLSPAPRASRTAAYTAASLLALAIATAAHAETRPQTEADNSAFRITHEVADTGSVEAESQMAVKADSAAVQPMLNVVMDAGEKRLASIGQPVTFKTYWNYAHYITRGEIRIFNARQAADETPYKIVPLTPDGQAEFTPGAIDPQAMLYVLRVYNADGLFDETRPAELSLASNGQTEIQPVDPAMLFGRDNSARRNIAVSGSGFTATGKAEAADSVVKVNGQQVPVSEDGSYVTQQILPFGLQDVNVEITDAKSGTSSISRTIDIPKDEWFYVAIGDITLGSNDASGPAALVAGNDEEFDNLYLNTRGAFYVKGRIGGRTRLTASLDTGEASIKNIFSNLNDKDPRQLLRRLDASLYYPSYGDDSSTVEDAPTQGRFYLRVDRDDSKLVLGNYVVDASGTTLAQLDRGLYGALGDYVSTATTSFGERKTRITAFASDPGTAPAREEFRGTGGSAYFLQRQDLSIGSERLRVEIRDKDSGMVLETRDLRPQEDYDIDYIQGRVLLTRPLSSSAADGQTVRTGNSPGHLAVLVVRYEYTPTVSDIGGYTFGGRATHWLGEVARLGITAQREATGDADQNLLGADLFLRKSATTFLKAEIARTEGPAFGQANSVDGGLNFFSVAGPGQRNQNATSWRVEGAAAFNDLLGKQAQAIDHGNASAYYEHLGAGFSGAGRLSTDSVNRWGAKLALPVTASTMLTADYDEVQARVLGDSRSLDMGVEQKFGAVKANLGVRYEDRGATNFLNNVVQSGKRADLALQVGYDAPAGWAVFGFGQTTLDRDAGRQANSRAGIGGRYEVNDRMSFNAEVSQGDGGLGASVGLTRRIGENAETYFNYALTTENSDSRFEAQSLLTRSNFGTFTIGGKARLGSSLNVHGEERLGLAPRSRELLHSYGFEFTPGKRWSFSGTFEDGSITDQQSGSFDRTAATASFGYSTEGLRMASSLEARFEKGLNRNQTSWLSRSSIGYDANPAWRVLGRLNFAISDADNNSLLNAGFVEGVVGIAYRPVTNNRVNALVKYTYFQDTATYGQLTAAGTTAAPKQRSQILSADVTYKLTNWLSLGGKYGFRFGEVALSRSSDVFLSSKAHLAIVRADFHIVKKWDALVEARYLGVKQAGDSRTGVLVGLYRHLGDHAKVGVGYSFSEFSDDLTNLEYRSKGLFLNVIGKF